MRFQRAQVHGRWHSLPDEPWQNACWCVEIAADLGYVADAMEKRLAYLTGKYRQDSIAWSTAETKFIRPTN